MRATSVNGRRSYHHTMLSDLAALKDSGKSLSYYQDSAAREVLPKLSDFIVECAQRIAVIHL